MKNQKATIIYGYKTNRPVSWCAMSMDERYAFIQENQIFIRRIGRLKAETVRKLVVNAGIEHVSSITVR